MILSGMDIQWYIEKGKLKIEPVKPEQFQQNGVDLILSEIEGLQTDGRTEMVDWILPIRFYLGATAETLTLPDDLMGFVQLRSGWARKGFLIPPTVVDAGFQGNLTIEIFSAGYIGVAPIGERFLHLILARLTTPGDAYSGKYQGQTGITPSKL